MDKNKSKNILWLEAKLKAERIRRKRLEHRVRSLEEKIEKSRSRSDRLKSTSPDVAIEKYTSYLKYKYNTLKSTDVWNTAERVVSYSRTSLFIARLFKYASAIVAFIETSAVFLICATVLLFVIPATLLLALILMLIDMAGGKKFNEKILPRLKNKKIIFLVAQAGFRENRGTYFDNMAKDFAKNENYFTVVVSKSLRDGKFLTAKFVGDNLVVIRETYFFRLKKAIIKSGISEKNLIIVH